jgi:hypothetical protein
MNWFVRLVDGFSLQRHVFDPRSGHVGTVVNKVTWGRSFSEYFVFPYQLSFRRLLHIY